MPRFIGPLTKKQSLARLSKKVNKNTRLLGSREIKNVRVDIDATPDTTAVVQNVSFVAQGDGVTQRSGNKIKANSISCAGTLIKAAASSSNGVRILIFRDNNGTTTAPVLTDLFLDENDFFNNQQRIQDPQNMARFSILWDKYIILNEGFDGQTTMVKYNFHKKLNHNIYFSGSLNTNEGKNGIWIMTGSDEASVVPALAGSTIFKFSDL